MIRIYIALFLAYSKSDEIKIFLAKCWIKSDIDRFDQNMEICLINLEIDKRIFRFILCDLILSITDFAKRGLKGMTTVTFPGS